MAAIAHTGAAAGALPLWQRFPAAHQFLRMRLLDEIFPITPALACWAEPLEPEAWRVWLSWPAIDYQASRHFSGAELRCVFGRWSSWARTCALDIADRLPV